MHWHNPKLKLTVSTYTHADVPSQAHNGPSCLSFDSSQSSKIVSGCLSYKFPQIYPKLKVQLLKSSAVARWLNRLGGVEEKARPQHRRDTGSIPSSGAFSLAKCSIKYIWQRSRQCSQEGSRWQITSSLQHPCSSVCTHCLILSTINSSDQQWELATTRSAVQG